MQLFWAKAARFFSPEFICDFLARDLKLDGNVLRLPKGSRGSEDDPAEILMVRENLGSLVDESAFENTTPICESAGAAIRRELAI